MEKNEVNYGQQATPFLTVVFSFNSLKQYYFGDLRRLGFNSSHKHKVKNIY